MKKRANQGGLASPLTMKTARGGRVGAGLSLKVLWSPETLLSLRTLKGDTVSFISISSLTHLALEQD